jgi:hypothetical protein
MLDEPKLPCASAVSFNEPFVTDGHCLRFRFA